MDNLINYFDVIPAQAEIQQSISLMAMDSGVCRNDELYEVSL